MGRTYDDPCGLARALDLVGDRWALLVIRELLLGPKRFAQLRRGLPGASQSMLTQRLTDMEENGILQRRFLGPPTSARVYELTDHGRALEPALIALARWGSRTSLAASTELSVDAMAMAMRTVYSGGAPAARFRLILDGDGLTVSVDGDRLDIRREHATGPVTTIETSVAVWREILFAGKPMAAAERDGDLTVDGDRAAIEHLVTLFPRPRPGAD